MKTTYQTAHNLCIWITIIRWKNMNCMVGYLFIWQKSKKYNLIFFQFVTHYEIVNVGTKSHQIETDSYFSFFKISVLSVAFFGIVRVSIKCSHNQPMYRFFFFMYRFFVHLIFVFFFQFLLYIHNFIFLRLMVWKSKAILFFKFF